MMTGRIIPCLDCRDGRVVKGVRFQGLRDVGEPGALAARYEEEGADEIVVLDVAATPRGQRHAVETIERVRRAIAIPLTVGGGIRDAEGARQLLEAGADRVAVNTAAVRRPELIGELAADFGRQCVVVAVDAARAAAGRYDVFVRSGGEAAGRDAVAWCLEAAERGAGEILLTSVDRDGTGLGYDVSLLAAVAHAVPISVIASGGADGPEHFRMAFEAGCDAVLAASIFHDGVYRVEQIKSYLAPHGVRVRPC